ncbi:MAG: zinc ribbon domain-containing protein [Caldilineales bacterium]|nr:zinc ribbon domain-containing protein [Caldilineales bacterium]
MPEQFANLIGVGLEWVVAISGGLLVAFWVGLIVWTWRDIRTRSSDIFAALLATLLVAIFSVLGVLLYLLLRPKHTLAEQYDRALEEEALLREIEQAPHCHKCGRPAEVDWQFCPHCETELRHPCQQCGELLNPEWKRCPHCGAYPGKQAKRSADIVPPPAAATQVVSDPMVAAPAVASKPASITAEIPAYEQFAPPDRRPAEIESAPANQ